MNIKLSAGISPIIIELYFCRSLVSDVNMGSVSFDVAEMYKASLRVNFLSFILLLFSFSFHSYFLFLQFRSERNPGQSEPPSSSILRWLNIKAKDASLSAELLIELRPLKKGEEMKEKRHLIEV